MDAPPPESVQEFVDVARLFAAAGLRVPQVHAFDPQLGFCLLEDLGDELLCRGHRPDGQMYAQAWRSIIRLQRNVDASRLPPFDRAFIRRELELFPQWYCADFKRRPLDRREQQAWQQACDHLAAALTGQPQVAMHRDYHSRNLMVVGDEIAIIDFQGACRGPIAYDPASLGRDLYAPIDRSQEEELLARFHAASVAAGLPVAADLSDYLPLYEHAAAQRLTKVLGLFVRIDRKLGKRRFLDHLPACAQSLCDLASRHRPLRPIAAMIEARA